MSLLACRSEPLWRGSASSPQQGEFERKLAEAPVGYQGLRTANGRNSSWTLIREAMLAAARESGAPKSQAFVEWRLRAGRAGFARTGDFLATRLWLEGLREVESSAPPMRPASITRNTRRGRHEPHLTATRRTPGRRKSAPACPFRRCQGLLPGFSRPPRRARWSRPCTGIIPDLEDVAFGCASGTSGALQQVRLPRHEEGLRALAAFEDCQDHPPPGEGC